MSENLDKNIYKNSEYIPLSEAGKILNTSRDYMNVLVRRGKLHAVKLGRNWVTTKEWLNEYQKSVGRLPVLNSDTKVYPMSDFSVKEVSRFQDLNISEKDEFKNLKSSLILEREKALQIKALIPEIKIDSRELQIEERKNIIEAAQKQFRTIDVSEFQKASRQVGILKNLKQWSNLKLSIASGLITILLVVSLGFVSGAIPGLNVLKFKDLNISQFRNLKSHELQANILSDVFKNFPNDIPLFYKWFTLSLSKGLAFLKSKTPSELVVGELPKGESKIVKPQEILPNINTLDEAFALDAGLDEEDALPSFAEATEGQQGGGNFILLENRLSVVEADLAGQKALTQAELSLQKKTILGTLETLIGISKLLPTYPISTIVVQGQPATLTSYSIAPSVHSGFDRLSANYFNLANNAEINGSLTVKSGGTFNTLSVSGSLGAGATTLSSLTVSGDTILGNTTLTNASSTYLTVSNSAWFNNLTVSGTTNLGGISFANASSTYLTVSDTAWVNKLAVTSAATTTFNGPISSFSGNLIIAGDSANNLLFNPYGGNVGIGTTSPGNLLSVHSSGNVYIGGDLTVSGTTNLSGSSFNLVNASTTDLTVAGNAWITNGTVTNLTATNASTSALTINFSASQSTSTTPFNVYSATSSVFSIAPSGLVTAGNFNSTTATLTSASSTNLTATNFWSTNGTITTGTITNSSSTNLTATNFWSTNGTITNASTTYLTVANAAFFPGSGIWDSSGNVGIGTVNPLSKLDVNGGVAIGSYAGSNSAPGNGMIVSGYLGVGSSSPMAVLAVNVSNATGTTAALNINSATSSLLYVRSDGNVGIGTTAPNEQLEITGNLRLPATTASAGIIKSGADNLLHTSGGTGNLFLGINAGNLNINSTFTDQNTGIGYEALTSLGTGGYDDNTAVGYQALKNTTTGLSNSALGSQALSANTTGSNNSVLGHQALFNNTKGSNNAAIGYATLVNNTTGSNNSALGSYTLYWNGSATNTVAIGYNAAQGTAAYNNQGGTYLGYQAGYSAGTGSNYNTLVGYQAGYGITTGSNNIWIGTATSSTSIANLTTGSQNILIGNNISLPSATAKGQLNIGNIIYGTGVLGTGTTLSRANIGIGTSTPLSKLDVNGGVAIGSYAGSNSAPGNGMILSGYLGVGSSSPMAVLSVNVSNATGTTAALNINSATSSLLYVRSDGNIGIGTTSPTQSLTIQGNQFISGGLGIGISTTTSGVLQTSGDVFVGRNLFVSGNSTTLGASSADTLTINSSINSNLIPDQNALRNLGSTSFYWNNGYINTLTVNNISAASTTIGGTQSSTFTINSDNNSADNEDSSLIFFRGTIVPNAILSWNSATSSRRFEFNQALYINNSSASTTNPTLTVQSIANQTSNTFQIIDNNSSAYFTVNPVGSNTTMVNASTTVLTAPTFFSTTGTITNASSTNLTATNFWSTNGTITNLTTTGGTITNASSTYLTVSDTAWITKGIITNASTTYATLPTFWGTTGTVNTLTVTNGTITNASTTYATLPTFWSTSGNITNASTSALTINFSASQSTSTTPFNVYTSTSSVFSIAPSGLVTIPNFTSTTGIITSASSTNLTATNFWSTNGTITTGTITNSSSTNLTATNFWSTNGTITNASSTYLTVSDTSWIDKLISTNATTTTFRSSGLATFGGNVGIGTEAPGWKFDVTDGTGFTYSYVNERSVNIQRRSTAANTTEDDAVLIFHQISPSGAVAGKNYITLKTHAIGDTGQSPASIQGIESRAYQYGAGTTTLIGITAGARNKGVATISEAASFYAQDLVNDGGGAITNAYGLYIEPITVGTNRYDIYAQGPTSYFGGNVGIGTTSPGQLLSVNGNGFFAGNLTVATTTYTLNASSTNLTATNFWSTNGTITNASTTYLTVSGSAFLASSTMNGFNICTAGNGVCATGASLTGTTGQIAYFSGTNTAVGTSTLFIDINGNVGIGTTTPGNAFSVHSTGNAYFGGNLTVSGQTSLVNASTSALTINFSASQSTSTAPFNVYSSTSSVFSIAPSGLVTANNFTATTATLTSASSTNLTATNFWSTNGTITTGTITNSSSTNLTATNFWSTNGTITNASSTYLTVSDTAFFPGSGIWNSTGNVGIGTEGPLSKLDVNGGVAIGSYAGSNSAPGNGLIVSGYLGVGSSSPMAVLSVNVSNATGTTAALNINSATSSLLYVRSDGFIGIATTSASLFTTRYATSTPTLSVQGDVLISGALVIPNLNSTTTINGGFDLGAGALTYEPSSGVTSLSNITVGASIFEADSGLITWADMPVTPAVATGTQMGYTAQMAGNPVLSVFGIAGDNGGVTNIGVGIGTTTPFSTLSITASTTPTLGFGLNVATTSPRYGNLNFWTMGIDTNDLNKFKIASSTSIDTNTRLTIDSQGFVGIGTTSPGNLLSVNSTGNVYFGGNLTVSGTSTFANLSTFNNASTTNLSILSTGSFNLNATGTMQGYALCTAGNGACPTGASLTGTTGQIAYFSGTNTAVGTSTLFISTAGYVGIASTSPSAILSVNVDNALGNTPALNINSATSSLLYVRSDGFIGIATTSVSIFTTPYATTTPTLSISGDVLISNGGLNLPTITSTTTIGGGFDVGSRAFTVEPFSALTSIVNAEMGATNFETDAGVVSWIDMPATSASANNTVLSYSAMMNGTSTITVYGIANGAGGVTNIGVGIGTTTPTAMLTISTANATSSVAITNGWLCIDKDGGCAGSAAGTMYSSYADITGGSDIAEKYSSLEALEAGDIVEYSKLQALSSKFQVEKATASSTTIIGIISSGPAMTVGSIENATTTYPVALAGRVPVKISLENGPIAAGDRITISSAAGVGMKATATTTAATVGIALESFDGLTTDSEGAATFSLTGSVLVFVNLGQPQLAASGGTGNLAEMTADTTSLSGDLNLNGFSLLNVKSISGLNNLWKIDDGGNITAQSVETQRLTIVGADSGVTIYDRGTGAPKCIYIEGGVIKTSDGACGATTNAGAPAVVETPPAPEAPAPSATTTPEAESPTSPSATTTPEIGLPLAETATSTPLEVSGAGAATVANGDLLLTGSTPTTVEPASEPIIIIETATTTP